MSQVIKYFDVVESGLCLKVNRLSHRLWIRSVFSAVSRLGDGGFWVLMGAALLVLQGPQAFPLILQMGATAAIGIIVYKQLKRHLVRERPYINHVGIMCGAAPLDRYSFPSGHTLHAVSFSMMFSQFEPLLIPVVVPFALLVAASRIILGLHYPSDVVVGGAIGAILASTSLALV